MQTPKPVYILYAAVQCTIIPFALLCCGEDHGGKSWTMCLDHSFNSIFWGLKSGQAVAYK